MWKKVTVQQLNMHDIFAFKNNDTNVVLKGRVFLSSGNRMSIALMADSPVVQGIMQLPEWAIRPDSMLSTEAELMLHRLGLDKANADLVGRYKQVLKDMGIIEPSICTILQFAPDLEIPDSVWEEFEE